MRGTPSARSSGSLAAGFILIPELRYEGAIRVAVFASAALGIVALWLLLPVNRILAIAVSVGAVAGCAFFRPQAPMTLLVTSPLNVGNQRARALLRRRVAARAS